MGSKLIVTALGLNENSQLSGLQTLRISPSNPAIWQACSMKTTPDLPDELIRAAKLRAVSQGRTLRDLVSEYLRQGLGINEKPSLDVSTSPSTIEFNARGFPQYKCGPTSKIDPENLATLLELERSSLEEEDLRRVGQSL
jgi:plasmid stability protein